MKISQGNLKSIRRQENRFQIVLKLTGLWPVQLKHRAKFFLIIKQQKNSEYRRKKSV